MSVTPEAKPLVDALLDWGDQERQIAANETTQLLLAGLEVESLSQLRALVQAGRAHGRAVYIAENLYAMIRPRHVTAERRRRAHNEGGILVEQIAEELQTLHKLVVPLTEEELRLVMLYGRCAVCGAPRRGDLRVEYDERDGRSVATHVLTCLNGHDVE